MFNHNACNRMKYAHRVAQVLFSSGAKLFQCFLERGENDLERKKKKKKETHLSLENRTTHCSLSFDC